jgi:hypothetical protein
MDAKGQTAARLRVLPRAVDEGDKPDRAMASGAYIEIGAAGQFEALGRDILWLDSFSESESQDRITMETQRRRDLNAANPLIGGMGRVLLKCGLMLPDVPTAGNACRPSQ